MYIKDSYCISPQKTFNSEGIVEYTPHDSIRYFAQEPDYTNYIPKGMLRRMGKSVRLGVGAGLHLLPKNPQLDGILMASSNGAIEDCFKFLEQMVNYNEGTLTPTHFVQSTPNAPAGQLALMSKTTGYNTTYVSTGLAFEAALLDAKMLLEEGRGRTFMIGAVEELSECHYVVHNKVNHFKKETINANALLASDTEGTVYGEGAASFIVTNTPTEEGIRITDIDQINFPEKDEIEERIDDFLNRNGLSVNDIDAVVIGMNGDNRFDYRYNSLLETLFANQGVYTYKNMVGEFPTSSSFATWMSYQLLKGNPMPNEAQFRTSRQPLNKILIYNHYYDQYHGLILIEK